MKGQQYSYWELVAGIDKFQVTQPSCSKKEFDIVIVGAGFCGSWLAHFLLKQNPSLTIAIVERDFFNLGASVRNAGFLSCGNLSEWLADSQEFSWEETLLTLKARIEGIKLIQTELGHQASIFNCGSVDCDPITEEKENLLGRLNQGLQSMGYEPFYEVKEVNIGGKLKKLPWNRFDSEINPGGLLMKLHQSLRERGVAFYFQTNVNQIGNGEALVQTSEKPFSLKYGYGFVCTNAFARHLSKQTNVEPARGQIILTSELDTPTTHCLGFLRSGYDYFRFIGRRVLVGGGRLEFKAKENTDVLDVTPEIRQYLVRLAGEVIGHSNFTVDYHWSGIMGLRKGQHASISDLNRTIALDGKTEEVAGFGGWGVTLTPYVTQLRAAEFLSHRF